MLAGNAQRERDRERNRERARGNLHKINMQHFAVSAAGRHVSVWHVLHMQMCSQTREATRAAQIFPLSLLSVYYNSVKFLPTCWTARGALGMELDAGRSGSGSGEDAGLYLLCVINYIYSVAALAGHQNGLWQHLYKLSLPQECEANLSRCHASSLALSISLSHSYCLSLYLFIMCAANDNRVRAHAALQPQYFANQSGSSSNEQNMPRHGATTSCKQIKETRIRPHLTHNQQHLFPRWPFPTPTSTSTPNCDTATNDAPRPSGHIAIDIGDLLPEEAKRE